LFRSHQTRIDESCNGVNLLPGLSLVENGRSFSGGANSSRSEERKTLCILDARIVGGKLKNLVSFRTCFGKLTECITQWEDYLHLFWIVSRFLTRKRC